MILIYHSALGVAQSLMSQIIMIRQLQQNPPFRSSKKAVYDNFSSAVDPALSAFQPTSAANKTTDMCTLHPLVAPDDKPITISIIAGGLLTSPQLSVPARSVNTYEDLAKQFRVDDVYRGDELDVQVLLPGGLTLIGGNGIEWSEALGIVKECVWMREVNVVVSVRETI
jgi:hypothetical protein